MNQRVRSWYDKRLVPIKNSSCQFHKCFFGRRLRLRFTTLMHFDTLVYTSTDTSLDLCEMHVCPCGSWENKSGMIRVVNRDLIFKTKERVPSPKSS